VNNIKDKTILSSLEFNIFPYKDAGDIETLIVFLLYMFQDLDLIEECDLPLTRLYRYIKAISYRYRSVPYHNFYHAFNTTQTLYHFLKECDCKNIFTPPEILVMMISMLSHDVDHPGLNNRFHKVLKTSLCKQFNFRSVLEHHHYLEAALILQKRESNIIINFDDEDQEQFNRIMKKINHFNRFVSPCINNSRARK